MNRIYPLHSQVANQIAAGEVVERPASVLKELLENSIDAGSTHIEVTIEAGGVGLIQVSDNGVGIHSQDLLLAVSSHATSKITQVADLEQIRFLGFRGEALASIASVSRIALSSRVKEEATGWCLTMAGGEGEPEVQPSAQPYGTLIAVRDLFFNTPARRKFLRTDKTEWLALEEVFKRIALSQFSIGFRLIRDGKIVKQLPACQNEAARVRRLAALCGDRFTEQSYCVTAEGEDLKITGWLSTLNSARAQPDLQYFYVNGRMVRDKLITHALRSVYQDQYPAGRYPAYVLYLELDPKNVDVNVHPTKHEVRFKDSRRVHTFLVSSLTEAFLCTLDSSLNGSRENTPVSSNSTEISLRHAALVDAGWHQNREGETQAERQLERQADQEEIGTETGVTETAIVEKTAHSVALMAAQALPDAGEKQSVVLPLRQSVFSLLWGGSILIQEEPDKNTVLVVFLPAARAHLVRSVLKEGVRGGTLITRPLWMPKTVHVGYSGVEKIEACTFLGFEVEPLGPETLIVRSAPEVLMVEGVSIETVIQDIVQANSVESSIARITEYIRRVQETSGCSVATAEQILRQLEHNGLLEQGVKGVWKRMTRQEWIAMVL